MRKKLRWLALLALDWMFVTLPAALFIAFIDYTAWCAWWI